MKRGGPRQWKRQDFRTCPHKKQEISCWCGSKILIISFGNGSKCGYHVRGLLNFGFIFEPSGSVWCNHRCEFYPSNCGCLIRVATSPNARVEATLHATGTKVIQTYTLQGTKISHLGVFNSALEGDILVAWRATLYPITHFIQRIAG